MEISKEKIDELNLHMFMLEERRNRLLNRNTEQSRKERNEIGYAMRGITTAAEILGIELEGKWGASFYKRRG
jgi:hypothetical protein